MPALLEMLIGWSVGSPKEMARPGQFSAHLVQILQNSVTPNSIGLSGTKGKSVNTLQSLTLGPNFSVIRSPWRPSCPKPASMASGVLKAVSLPQGIAL
jgi:hypothetical protein